MDKSKFIDEFKYLKYKWIFFINESISKISW